jgi:mRNA interferase RelE/StbE
MYRIKFAETASKQFYKLDAFTQKMIQKYINKNLNGTDNPRRFGKVLKGAFSGMWRYEVGKYRLVCDIQDGVFCILVIKVGHRREVYGR